LPHKPAYPLAGLKFDVERELDQRLQAKIALLGEPAQEAPVRASRWRMACA
jgi:hypothetical protein